MRDCSWGFWLSFLVTVAFGTASGAYLGWALPLPWGWLAAVVCGFFWGSVYALWLLRPAMRRTRELELIEALRDFRKDTGQ